MTRKQLAQQVYGLMRRIDSKKSLAQIWIEIAEMNDAELRQKYVELLNKNYSLKEQEEEDIEEVEVDSRPDYITRQCELADY